MTIDQSDIRGSEAHNHDPSGVASDCYASPVEPVAYAERGFSFVLPLAAAGSVFEMDVDVHDSVLIFSFLGGFVLGCCQAATCCLETVSALVPIAQINPSSSRATSVTIFLWSLPAAPSFTYRLCNRCCAFHAISLVSSEMLSCRLRRPYKIPGGRR